MLERLVLTNFTAFAEADLRFCDGLNVLIGENGVGKTHLLKLPYAVMASIAENGRSGNGRPTKALLERRIADKLVHVLRPETLGRLARRQQGRQSCEVELHLASDARVSFNFATQSKSKVGMGAIPARWLPHAPVFLPTRELLSIYPGFSALYDTRHVEFDEEWRDTCQRLGSPTLRGPRAEPARELLEVLERLMGGRLQLDRGNGRFYLRSQIGTLEMPLVAEGVRKLGMLARLIATGALTYDGCLFWDEPETNLNPRLIRGVAEAILGVVKHGGQVFVATHSLFLLREFEVLFSGDEYGHVPRRFFALGQGDGGVAVQQGDRIEDVDPLALLDADLEQSDRYLDLRPWHRLLADRSQGLPQPPPNQAF